jgi:hypothetical protein
VLLLVLHCMHHAGVSTYKLQAASHLLAAGLRSINHVHALHRNPSSPHTCCDPVQTDSRARQCIDQAPFCCCCILCRLTYKGRVVRCPAPVNTALSAAPHLLAAGLRSIDHVHALRERPKCPIYSRLKLPHAFQISCRCIYLQVTAASHLFTAGLRSIDHVHALHERPKSPIHPRLTHAVTP